MFSTKKGFDFYPGFFDPKKEKNLQRAGHHLPWPLKGDKAWEVACSFAEKWEAVINIQIQEKKWNFVRWLWENLVILPLRDPVSNQPLLLKATALIFHTYNSFSTLTSAWTKNTFFAQTHVSSITNFGLIISFMDSSRLLKF